MMGLLDSIRPIPLVSTRAGALFDFREHLLYLTDDGTLLARRLDVALRLLTGRPVPVATGGAWNRANGRARFSVSASGVLVHSGRVRAKMSEDRYLMSVALAPTAADPHASLPQRLVDLRWLQADRHLTMPFAMTRDAQRFLVAPVVREFLNAPVTVITSWAVALPTAYRARLNRDRE